MKKSKAPVHVSCLKNCCCQSQIFSILIVLTTVSQRLVAGIYSNYFLAAIWSQSQELQVLYIVTGLSKCLITGLHFVKYYGNHSLINNFAPWGGTSINI